MAISKKTREIVWKKYGGRCAYCGREIAYKDMQVDHFLPLEPGRSMLCQEYFERPWVMKNVTLCVQYKSSAGIIFYMGYDVFRGLVKRGRITPLSQEGEETLEGKANV